MHSVGLITFGVQGISIACHYLTVVMSMNPSRDTLVGSGDPTAQVIRESESPSKWKRAQEIDPEENFGRRRGARFIEHPVPALPLLTGRREALLETTSYEPCCRRREIQACERST